MKVLVTGGAGFIGSYIVDFLTKEDYEVVIIDNLSTGKKENINNSATFYDADILNPILINSLFEAEKPDIVIHSAAQVMLRKSLEDPVFDAKTNIIGTINILEACKNNKIKKIIYTSTGGARVGEPKYLPVDEKHPLNPSSPYGISKHTAEHYVDMYCNLHNIHYLIFCFGNVYGPRDDPSCKRVTSIFSQLMINGESPIIFGDGNQTRDFIYVKDLAEFIVKSVNKDTKSRIFHLANGNQISVNEVFNLLKEITDFKGNPMHVDAIKGEVRDIVLDTSLVKKELGWEPKTEFKQGLIEIVNHLKLNKSS